MGFKLRPRAYCLGTLPLSLKESPGQGVLFSKKLLDPKGKILIINISTYRLDLKSHDTKQDGSPSFSKG